MPSWNRVCCWVLFPVLIHFYAPLMALVVGGAFSLGHFGVLILWWMVFYGIVEFYNWSPVRTDMDVVWAKWKSGNGEFKNEK